MWQPFDYAQMIIWIGALYAWNLDKAPSRQPLREMSEKAPAEAAP